MSPRGDVRIQITANNNNNNNNNNNVICPQEVMSGYR